MHDQASKLRELMRARGAPPLPPGEGRGEGAPETGRGEVAVPASPCPPVAASSPSSPRPWVIAVSSGKGGAGKSHVAANLAYCTARAGHRTLLVDADLGTANLDLLLGLTPGRNLGHVVTGQADLGATLMEGPGGMLFLPGASGLAQAADLGDSHRERLMRELLGLEESAELIVIDTGAGVSRNVTAFALSADQLVVVTTPEATAMTDAYALIKVLHSERFAGRLGVVVNQAADGGEARTVFTRLAKTAQRFLGVEIADLGWLPQDPLVVWAVRARRPVVACQPAAKVSRALAALSVRLLAERPAAPVSSSRAGLFRKIAGLFF